MSGRPSASTQKAAARRKATAKRETPSGYSRLTAYDRALVDECVRLLRLARKGGAR